MSGDSPVAANLPAAPKPTASETFWSNLQSLGYCLFALVGGLVLLGWQWMSRAEAAATLQWPVTPGKIVTSEVQEKQVYRSKRFRQVFDPQIEFKYQVAGQDYTGNRIDYLDDNDSENEQTAAAVSSNYPVGRDVNVSYDPQDPASSLLEPGVPSKNALLGWLIIGMGGFLTLVGLLGSVGSAYSLVAPGNSAEASVPT